MRTNGRRSAVPTRFSRGRRYADYDKEDLAVLADARRWLNSNGMKEQSQFTPEEADRRIAYYRRQLESQGQITQWLPPVQPKPKSRYRTRFAFGDAMGRFGQARAS